MKSNNSNPKNDSKKSKKGIEHWLQLYLQAKIDNDFHKIKMYGAILLKLGQKLPKP